MTKDDVTHTLRTLQEGELEPVRVPGPYDIVLGILYESFIHPITILTGLPAAAFGGLATLSLFHMLLDIYGFVGLIMLIGIVKKNAIMMIDFSLELKRNENYSVHESA